ncbi:MAG: urease accessory protein UreD [Pseudomonadota bacterium]
MMLRVPDSDARMPPVPCAAPGPAMLQRAKGEGIIAVDRTAQGEHRIAGLRQSGAAKILCPRNHLDAAFEAVLLNTAGGLAGGDHLRWEASAGRDAMLRVTTQTAERVYRSNSGDARVETCLRVDAGAALEWLPQETILFDGSRLSRTLSIDLAGNAGLLAVEAIVLGRRAHGERVRSGSLRDHWRVRRDGRLVYADSVRMDGGIAALADRPATLGGAQAFATLVLAGPDRMPIDDLRAILPAGDGVEAAASALPHVTVVRMIAAHGDVLRPALSHLLLSLRGAALPRVWQA